MASIAQQLKEKLGGEWRYDRKLGHWVSDDPHRWVSKVHTGGVDVNGEALPSYGYFLHDLRADKSERLYLFDDAMRRTQKEPPLPETEIAVINVASDVVFLAEKCDYDEHAIDSIWTNECKAKGRADELNAELKRRYVKRPPFLWEVRPFVLNRNEQPDERMILAAVARDRTRTKVVA